MIRQSLKIKQLQKLQQQRSIHDIIFLIIFVNLSLNIALEWDSIKSELYSSSGNEGKYGVKSKQSRTVEVVMAFSNKFILDNFLHYHRLNGGAFLCFYHNPSHNFFFSDLAERMSTKA